MAFINKTKLIQYPFKFPVIDSDEIRINVYYVGLCQSDVHTVREVWGPYQYTIAPGHEIIGEVSLFGCNVKDFKEGEIVGSEHLEIIVKNGDFAKKERKIYAWMETSFMDFIGGDMLLLCNNLQNFIFSFLKDLNMKKQLLYSLLELLLFILLKNFK